ncbi:MAG: hypothetical protein BSOLF_2168 [Candidatus Carbobacillus altaicus]|uniref:Thiamin pyrophosphokinase n=1 Tax=Candidatus Carbonibacillus altaicus TaxID=2163959 RepID=A0A2R6Y371_9BACL|nr:MAG: hypothetical protein BSOLF_2168 [Candidatus Carbobacillus altaicus]
MFLQHSDLDRLMAASIARKLPVAIVNLRPYLSGQYAAPGVYDLMETGIPLFETGDGAGRLLTFLKNYPVGHAVLWRRRLYITASDQMLMTVLRPVRPPTLQRELIRLKETWQARFRDIAYNTAVFMQQEVETMGAPYVWPAVTEQLKGKTVLILIRSATSEADLQALHQAYDLSDWMFIGVDGGADSLLTYGLRPHFVVGDFDSVSDRALTLSLERLLHVYADGRAPERERLLKLNLPFYTISVPGTSEDVAIRMAVESEAETIFVIGRHHTLLDALEKGRKGLSSTVLLTLMYGHRFDDLTGFADWQKRFAQKGHTAPDVPSVSDGTWTGTDTV